MRVLKWLGGTFLVLALCVAGLYWQRDAVVAWVIDQRGLSEPFIGLTTQGRVREGLFAIRPTGVPTTPVRQAAIRFIESLSPRLRASALFPVDADEWRRWSNIHMYRRQGAGLLDMDPSQRAAAQGLLETALSPRGYAQTQDIMRLDTALEELLGGDLPLYGEERFWFTMMGQPHATEPWGWQLDGHHLIINYFVLGDQVVMTPLFLGAEPVVASTGRHAGVAVLQAEQDAGLAMLRALDPAQRKAAILSDAKPGNNNQAEFNSDNVIVPFAGLSAGALAPAQREQLLDLIELYVGHMAPAHARVKMAEVEAYLDETWFAWVGGTDSQSKYYYRIHSPVIYIEFDHQLPVALGHLAEDDGPQRNHIHAVMRTPNGNDYGKALLEQHLEAHPH